MQSIWLVGLALNWNYCQILNSLLFPTNSFLLIAAHPSLDLLMLTINLDSFVILLFLSTPKSRTSFQESSLSRFPLICFFLPFHFNSGILHPKQLQEPPAVLSATSLSRPVHPACCYTLNHVRALPLPWLPCSRTWHGCPCPHLVLSLIPMKGLTQEDRPVWIGNIKCATHHSFLLTFYLGSKRKIALLAIS